MPSFVYPLVLTFQVLSALVVVILVLLQQGKGSDMGSSFGGGSAGSLFGSAGSANFFSRLTKWCAVVFFASTLALTYLSQGSTHTAPVPGSGLIDSLPQDALVPSTISVVPAAQDNSAVPVAPSN